MATNAKRDVPWPMVARQTRTRVANMPKMAYVPNCGATPACGVNYLNHHRRHGQRHDDAQVRDPALQVPPHDCRGSKYCQTCQQPVHSRRANAPVHNAVAAVPMRQQCEDPDIDLASEQVAYQCAAEEREEVYPFRHENGRRDENQRQRQAGNAVDARASGRKRSHIRRLPRRLHGYNRSPPDPEAYSAKAIAVKSHRTHVMARIVSWLTASPVSRRNRE